MPIGATISLQGNNGKFLSSENGTKEMICNRNTVGGWEKFTVTSLGTNQVTLKGNNNKYVSSENGASPIHCDRDSVGAWERFTWTQE